MIFYFSGTGNSAWAARQLARLTSDEAYDITNLKELPDICLLYTSDAADD